MQNIETLSNNVLESLREQQDTPEQRESVLERVRNSLDQLKTDTEKLAFKERFQMDFEKLRSKEQQEIAEHLQALRLPTEMGELFVELQNLKKDVEKSLPETVGDSLEDATDNFVPEKWTKDMTRGEKIATSVVGAGAIAAGTAVVVKGASSVWNWMTGAAEKAKSGTKKAGRSLLKYGLIASIPVAVLFGPKIAEKVKEKLSQVIQSEVADNIKDKTKEYSDKVKGVVGGLLDGEQEKANTYSEQERAKAEEAYRYAKEGEKEAAVRQALGLQANETTPEFKDIMEELDKKYETVRDPETEVLYAKSEVALQNYTNGIEIALHELKQWISNHKVLVFSGGLAAQRLGLLRLLFSTGKKSAEEMTSLSLKIMQLGLRHPILSFIALSGTAIVALRSKKNAMIPENLGQLASACNKGGEIILKGSTSIGAEVTEKMQEYAADLKDLSGDVGTWLQEKSGTLLDSVGEQLPSIINLSDSEIIAHRNSLGVQSLRDELWKIKKSTEDSDKERRSKKREQATQATELLDEYELALFAGPEGEWKPSEKAPDALEKLQSALKDLKIELVVEGGVVTWQAEEGMPQDLSIDPSIKDKQQAVELSQELYQEQGVDSYIFSRAIEQYRSILHGEAERLPGPEWVGMVIGNFLYFASPKGAKEYFCANKDVITSIKTDSFIEWSGDVGEAMAVTGTFALGTGAVAKLKRLAIGGGPLESRRWLRYAQNVTPGAQQLYMARSMWRAKEELKMFRKLNYWDARLANTVMANGKIRPEWIRYIEKGNPRQLNYVIGELDEAHIPANADAPTIRQKLRDAYLDRMETVKVRQYRRLQGTSIKHKAKVTTLGKPLSRVKAEEIYDKLNEAISGTPKPGQRVAGAARAAATRFVEPKSKTPEKAKTSEKTKTKQKPKKSASTKARATAKAGATAEAPEAAPSAKATETATKRAPQNIDELRAAVKNVDSYDEAEGMIRAYQRGANELDVQKYIGLLEDESLQELAKSAGKADDLRDMQRATETAAKAAKRAKLLTGGKVAGAALGTFGVLVDGYLMYSTHQQIEAARERGNEADAEILEKKLYTQAGTTAMNAAAGGVMLFSGPVGWIALGGSTAVDIAKDPLYEYALDANHTNLKEYSRLSPEEQMALLHGEGDWLIDSREIQDYRHETALEAYVQRTDLAALDGLDERYMEEVLAESESWEGEDVSKPETQQRMREWLLQKKNADRRRDVLDFIKSTDALESPSAKRLEEAGYYAELKHVERRAEELGEPELFADMLASLGVDNVQGELQPEDLVKKGKKTVEKFVPGGFMSPGQNVAVTETAYKEQPLAEALREKKIDGLLQQLNLLQTMVEAGHMNKISAQGKFTSLVTDTLLKHDINLFKAPVAGKSKVDQHEYTDTVQQIMFHEIGELFEYKDVDKPEVFRKKVLDVQQKVRAFMAKQQPLSLEQREPNDSHFGPDSGKPRWYLSNVLDVERN